MPTGPELITAIVGKANLMSVNNCPGVPTSMGHAFYGACQDDAGKGESIVPGKQADMQKQINNVIGFGGANSETAVWHFSLAPVHHFVVVPWYKHDFPHGQVYAVFMAYETKYTVDQYVKGTGVAPTLGADGYKEAWTVNQLSSMLSDLLTSGTAWQDYLGQVGAARATKITVWKYKTVTLQSAIKNVNAY